MKTQKVAAVAAAVAADDDDDDDDDDDELGCNYALTVESEISKTC